MVKKSTQKREWVTNDFGHHYLGKRLYQGRSAFQKMEIFKSQTFGTLLFLDGKIQISEKDENRYHQYLVAAPLLAHAHAASICIIGGGDCFSLEEAIKHPALKRILMLEIDAGVVAFCTRHYPVIRKIRRDKRIEIVYTDARRWLEQSAEKFDVVVVDLTEPHGPSKMLYTREFYRLCQKRLRPGGILSIHTDNFSLFPESFATIYKTLSSVFAHILTARVDMPCFGMGWTYRLASTRPISYQRLVARTRRLQKHGVVLDQFTPTTYLAEPTPEESKVLQTRGRVSTDADPFDKFARMDKKVTR
ncbi:fused MFS/spermidine synthase [candidate division FCPU426 bacterium]|nr:fused MFS/spermidine synthase [candidate division FCPU426 bacterium]